MRGFASKTFSLRNGNGQPFRGSDNLRYQTQKLQTIFGSRLLQLLSLEEVSGLTATDLSGNGRNGAYSAAGVTYGQPGIGDGKTSVLLAGGYVGLHSASLAAAFDPLEFSIIVWGKVANAGVWTDATVRTLMALGVDANNYIQLNKTVTNNVLSATYMAGGTAKARTIGAISASGFFSMGITVSKSNDRMTGYYNGQPMTTAINALGVWAGSLAAARCNVGVRIAPGTEPWSGYAAYSAIIDGEATAAEMLAAGTPLV